MNNNKKTIKLELLAPAKNLATGKIAILSGADAVYIGGPNFGARSAAGNSWKDIEELIDFAHQYYAKIYLTLNTIFFNNELPEVKEFIDKAYQLGADALIVQDFGILEMDLPPIPLFASTQCNNYEADQVEFLAKAGFSRAILARELNINEIKKIRELTAVTHPTQEGNQIDLEFFVHGALCVSLSGRCYFSQAVCGRSANRGQCAQICRQPFNLIDSRGKVIEQNKYLLSPKDLNLLQSLPELLEAGITSFKIEGRLKDEAYVGNVVAAYRQELDKIIDQSEGKYIRASSGKSKFDFIPNLNKTFNRGYTEYFLHGRHGDIISSRTPKSLGELIGKVESAERSHFSLDIEHDLQNGDGICWFDREGELVGTNINMVRDGKIYPNKVLPLSIGSEIYRNEDVAFEKAVKRGASRRVALDFIIKETKDGLAIEAIDEDGNEAELKFKIDKIPAKKVELALENWREQLSKFGETIFYSRDIIFNWSEPYFVPLSMLNEWRRKLATAILKKRLKNYPQIKVEHEKSSHEFMAKDLDYSFNVANELAGKFYNRHGAKVCEKAFELQNDYRGKKIMTAKHCLKYYLGACPQKKGKKKVDFTEPLYLVNNGKKYPLNFDCAKCLMEIKN
jgi:23S rRNA 5-hydroxycytidine C2501 synthase